MCFRGPSILYLKQSLAAGPTDHLVYSDGLSSLTCDKYKSIAHFVNSLALGASV